jgi:ribosomal protein L16 Arg81 hydroxylase
LLLIVMGEPTPPRGAGHRPPSGLAELISPFDAGTFMAEYWEQRHLVLTRGDPGFYSGLLTIEDMDHLLATSKIRSSDLRTVADGQESPVADLVSAEAGNTAVVVEALYDRYRRGATINMLFLQEQWPPLMRLCRELATEMSASFHVNVYLTPSASRGLAAHYDTHDVFVCQVHGSKHWRLYHQPLRLPLSSQPHTTKNDDPGELIDEFDLRPGDLLYMPRGTVHEATSNDRTSLHMTIGIQPVLWADVVRRTVDRLVQADERFREALPAGFSHDDGARSRATQRAADLLAVLHKSMSPDTIVTTGYRQAILARRPDLAGHLLDLEVAQSFDLETKLRRRPDLRWRLFDENGSIELEFHGKRIRFPAHVEPQLRFVADADSFTGGDLPGDLDEPGRRVLLTLLLREGFLTALR